ncbi:TMhelix containing protein [Vibrio phage 1.253.O._10N.286.45.B12]|nr:TMhelix containing protein [Vibrio phage 1.235.O._10N.261.52.B2]AUR98578.1 TMhelix containing protein [Vibrio phage 1.253.O._10N.286.45.B12]
MKLRIVKALTIGTVIGLGVLVIIAVSPANATLASPNVQTNTSYPESLCADIVDTIRINNGYIQEERWAVKQGLEDLFINEFNSDWSAVDHYQSLQNIQDVELEVELLGELFMDNCEDKYYD